MRAYREYGIAASVANPIAYMSSSLITRAISAQSRGLKLVRRLLRVA